MTKFQIQNTATQRAEGKLQNEKRKIEEGVARGVEERGAFRFFRDDLQFFGGVPLGFRAWFFEK